METYNGKIALVAGGTGGVGEGIVKWFIEKGSLVVVPSRSPEKLEKLKRYIGGAADDRLVGIIGNIGKEEGAEQVRDEVLNRTGRIDAVVASLSQWWQGKSLINISEQEWKGVLNANLTTHFIAAKTFVPVLSHGGSYTFLTGYSSHTPHTGAGVISVAGAGQLMLRRMLSAELTGWHVRLNDIILAPIMTRSRGGVGSQEWLTPEDVGRFAGMLAFGEGSHINGQSFSLNDKGDLMRAIEYVGKGRGYQHNA